jgi:hypothetical protein
LKKAPTYSASIVQLARSLSVESVRVYLGLLKIMLPISILVRLLQQTGAIEHLGKAFGPIVVLLGLPAAGGLVWVNTLITNIYGGMITFHALGLSDALTVAQASVLCQLMLVAHTFPIELSVARKAGIPLLSMFIWRFGLALISAWVLSMSLSFLDVLQAPLSLPKAMALPSAEHTTWLSWGMNEVHRYALVFLVVFALMALMRFLKASGFIDAFSRSLKPIMDWLGIHAAVIPITVVGMTLGILYGGALMIEETKKNKIPAKDVFYAFCLMGLCHSIIEDSLLMMALGANVYTVFLFRPLWALATLFFLVRILNKIPERWLQKITHT